MKIKDGVYVLICGNLIIIEDEGEHYKCSYNPDGIWNSGYSFYKKFGYFPETDYLLYHLENAIYKGKL